MTYIPSLIKIFQLVQKMLGEERRRVHVYIAF